MAFITSCIIDATILLKHFDEIFVCFRIAPREKEKGYTRRIRKY